jgi:AbrB family looped-hinge helix DNA binding protein
VKDEQAALNPPGKRFYGAVTVSERGQIVIPSNARKDFGIRTGDKLLVLGDLEQGIGITTMSLLTKLLENTDILKGLVENAAGGDRTRPARKTKKAGK